MEIGSRVAQDAASGTYVMGKFDANAAAMLIEEADKAVERGATLGTFVDGVQSIIDRGCRVGIVDVSGHRVVEIDYPEDYRRATEIFR